MKDCTDILDRMEPAAALAMLVPQLKKLMALLDEEERTDFLTALLGGTGGDKIASMVHL